MLTQQGHLVEADRHWVVEPLAFLCASSAIAQAKKNQVIFKFHQLRTNQESSWVNVDNFNFI